MKQNTLACGRMNKAVGGRNRRTLIAFLCLAVLVTISTLSANGSLSRVSILMTQPSNNNLYALGLNLNSCRGLYLDVGTNIGTQIRKLYEQDKFPGAKVLPIFSEYFGESRKDICTIGFEPNPEHDAYLQNLEANLKCQRFPVKIFTRTAVHTEDGQMTFYRDVKSPDKYKEWGSSLTNWQNNSNPNSFVIVKTIDLSSLFGEIMQSISGKQIPVLMKMDIEGAEYGVLEKMSTNGQLCKVSASFIEWHPHMALKGINATKINQFVKLFGEINQCNARIISLDDESYQTNMTDIPFTNCIKR